MGKCLIQKGCSTKGLRDGLTEPNMVQTTLLTHLKANMSKLQISLRCGLNDFYVMIYCHLMVEGVVMAGTETRRCNGEQ